MGARSRPRFARYQFDPALEPASERYAQLRRLFDGDEHLMSSLQIEAFPQNERTDPPDWVFSNALVRTVILSEFPSLERRGLEYRRRAGRWAAVIYLFFRCQLPESEVSRLLGGSPNSIECLVRKVKRIAFNVLQEKCNQRDAIKTPYGSYIVRRMRLSEPKRSWFVFLQTFNKG